jgi:nanoRNase/pAp phosphatase (c-di-AMP/oligoRNAs hydrolase)
MPVLAEDLEKSHREFFTILRAKIMQSKRIGVTSHVNADPDAVSSCVSMVELIKILCPEAQIEAILPSMNRIASIIVGDCQIPSTWKTNWTEGYDLLIVMDTNDLFMTELPLNENQNAFAIPVMEIVMIDHHMEKADDGQSAPKFDLTLPIMKYGSSDAASTVEIISEFYQIHQIVPSKNLAKLMLFGIITDSGGFRYATARTINDVEFLLETGWKMRELMEVLQIRPAREERIAKLRAASRIGDVYYIDKWLLVITHCSSFDASAARSLIELGADLAFVVVIEKKQAFRITGRASEESIRTAGVNLSLIMEAIGKKFGGSGGGHDGAAGCYGTALTKEYVQELTPVILEEVRKQILKPNGGTAA